MWGHHDLQSIASGIIRGDLVQLNPGLTANFAETSRDQLANFPDKEV